MHKIATPQDLQAELRRLLAHSQEELPSRDVLAAELRILSDRVAGQPEILTTAALAHLPVGSIVWQWVRDEYGPEGRVNDSPLIVIPQGKLTPISQLPERANGQAPDGDPVAAWGHHEYALIAKGRGQLPTHGTAQRLAETWQRAHRGQK